ncbi:MAG: 5'-nucleotidase C-terminal domain-containing protein [Cyanobacteriota bacterium]
MLRGISSGNINNHKEYKKKSNFLTKYDHVLKPVNSQKPTPSPDFNQMISFLGKKIREVSAKPLTLLYMADTHSNIDNIPRLKTAINNVKSTFNNSLVIHAGDYGLGTGDLNLQIDLINNLGINLATLGNHEFFSGSENLTKALQKSKFLTLVSNLKIAPNNPLRELLDNNKLTKSTIKTIDGIKYGFIGATTCDVNKTSYQKFLNGNSVIDPLKTVELEVKKLENQGINKIILISHLGFDVDKQIAEYIPGIDVIVGGHTHTSINGVKEGYNLLKSPRNEEPVLLLHSGSYGDNLGVSHLIFNENGILQIGSSLDKLKDKFSKLFNKPAIINKTTNTLINAAVLPKDKDLSKILDDKLTLIAKSKKPIDCDWPIWGANQLGSLTADAVKEVTRAQISLIQAGGLRRAIDKGPVYAEYIKNQVIPFDTDIVKVRLTGKQILDALNHAAETAGEFDKKPGLLQVSGLCYSYDMLRPPEERVIPDKVLVQRGKDQYVPLDLNETYTVAYDKFLLRGGENFVSLKDAEIIQEYPGQSYATAIIEHLTRHGSPDNNKFKEYQNRIYVINKPQGNIADNIISLRNILKATLENKLDKIKPRIQNHLENDLFNKYQSRINLGKHPLGRLRKQ